MLLQSGTTPLMYAAEFGCIGIVRELLSSGASVDLTDNVSCLQTLTCNNIILKCI